MGKYSVGYHGPAGGRDMQDIATLTHDPIAINNVKQPKTVKIKR